jgi:hypothetical protein
MDNNHQEPNWAQLFRDFISLFLKGVVGLGRDLTREKLKPRELVPVLSASLIESCARHGVDLPSLSFQVAQDHLRVLGKQNAEVGAAIQELLDAHCEEIPLAVAINGPDFLPTLKHLFYGTADFEKASKRISKDLESPSYSFLPGFLSALLFGIIASSRQQGKGLRSKMKLLNKGVCKQLKAIETYSAHQRYLLAKYVEAKTGDPHGRAVAVIISAVNGSKEVLTENNYGMSRHRYLKKIKVWPLDILLLVA